MPNPITDERIQREICDKYLNEVSTCKLEKEYNINYTYLNEILTKFNIPRNKVGYLKQVLKGMDEQISLEYASGASVRGLAKKYDVDRDVIKRMVNQSGQIVRDKYESNKKVSNETEQKVLSIWSEEKSRRSVSKEIGIAERTLTRILDKHGLKYKKGPSTKGCPKKYGKEIIEEAAKMYLSGISMSEIRKKLFPKMGHNQLKNYFAELGIIDIRSGAEQNKQYSCNSNYFKDPHSPAKYFILGFIATDGYIHEGKKFLNIEIHNDDRETLEFIKKELEFTGELRYTPKKDSIMITIHDDVLVGDLVSLGIRQNKSLSLGPMEWIRDDIFIHFVNGVISGDGYIGHSRKTRLDIGFCGKSPFIRWFAEKIGRVFSIRLCQTIQKSGIYQYAITNISDSVKLASLIYENPPFIMKRKYNKYMEFLSDNKNKEASK